jgi:hypothetical protein
MVKIFGSGAGGSRNFRQAGAGAAQKWNDSATLGAMNEMLIYIVNMICSKILTSKETIRKYKT